jgi:hypothetical protein
VEKGAISVVEPVTRIEREEFDLRPFGQIRGLIDHQTSPSHPCLERHDDSLPYAPSARVTMSRASPRIVARWSALTMLSA